MRPIYRPLLPVLLGLALISPAAAVETRVVGRVLLTTVSDAVTGQPAGQMVPQSGATVRLITLDTERALKQTFSDARGYYAFYDVPLGVYRLEIVLNGKSGGGSVIKVGAGTTQVPDLSINWNDPCLPYYGKGFGPDYIRTKVNVPWRGSSEDWLRLAPRYRWRTGTTPASDAIAVLRVDRVQLAWVDSVSPDRRTFEVSQWNAAGSLKPGTPATCGVTTRFRALTHMTWSVGDNRIMGFISPPR